MLIYAISHHNAISISHFILEFLIKFKCKSIKLTLKKINYDFGLKIFIMNIKTYKSLCKL